MNTDISTFDDLDDTGRGIDEDESILQCLRRACLTVPGELAYAPDEGVPLRALLSRAHTDNGSEVEAAIEAQAIRDDRVAKASATLVSRDPIHIQVALVKADGGSVRLTLAGDALSLAVLRGP